MDSYKKYQIPILVFINSIWVTPFFSLFFDISKNFLFQYTALNILVFLLLCLFFCGIKNHFFQKYIAKILLWLGVGYFVLIFILFYHISNGFRDYKTYCTHFIPLVDRYYLVKHKYPNSLDEVDDKLKKYIRYSPKKCGYMHSNNNYVFYFNEGFSIYGYDSNTKKWWED